MTTANLMNVSSVKNVSAQTDASKKLQEENLEVAEVFAGLMNQTIDFSDSVVDDTSSNMDVSKANSKQSPVESYERYSYKDNQIDTAKEPSIEEKLEEAGEVLDEAEKKVIDALCEEYGVDEDTIQNLLDDMGLSALDLLNPKNLVNFIVQLTGIASEEELLLDGNFLSVMETLDNFAEGLMQELNVDRNGLQELVAEMHLVDDGTEVPMEFQQVLSNTLENVTNSEQTVDVHTAETVDSADGANMTEANTLDVSVEEEAELVVDNQNQIDTEETQSKDVVKETELASEQETGMETKVETKVENQEDASEIAQDKTESDIPMTGNEFDEEQSFTGNQHSEGNSLLDHNTNETLVIPQVTSNVGQAVEGQMMPQFNSYLSADTVQIIEQIVQQMRVNISNEITTMEMQMNPENLGKVYVNISSEEGVVNAQFHATNEVVKEALEVQIATLRENLNQAGVKVDAIEVTIASHEFERNLEQNHQKSEEQLSTEQKNVQKRRNLTIDSLDELSGMMTEEETLVAQIMKDNGNSVDFTA